MSNQNSDNAAEMQQAITLLQAGQTVQAEELMLRAARDAESTHGPNHPVTATAYNELGTILLNVNNLPAAIDAYRKACSSPMPTEDQALRDRLTFLMNLGMALQYAGQFKEAEEVLMQGLKARGKYYGTKHPGYAFGLEPLAALLMRQDRLEEAIEMLHDVVNNFWQNGHPRVATALALRAEALKMANVLESGFGDIASLPDNIVEEIVNHVVQRKDQADPRVLSKVLQDLLPTLKFRFGATHGLVTNTLTWIVNLEAMAGKQGDLPARMQAARELIAIYERQGKPNDVLQALQGLALAFSDAGRQEDAIDCYRVAAGRVSDPNQRSQLRRNFGLLLSDVKGDQETEAELRGAVDDGTGEMRNRAQVALGIFYQHRGRLTDAKPLLIAGLQGLNPAHSDAVVARSHLQALEAGKTCGCDNQGEAGEALAASFRDFVLSKLPADLLAKLDVRLENNDFKVEVHLQREPAEDELDHMNRVINHALAEFRQQLR